MAAERLKLTEDIRNKWRRVRSRLRAELGEAAFRTWLRPLSLDGLVDGQIVMRVPGDNMRDWVMSRCGDRLHDLWCGESDEVTGIAIHVGKPRRRPATREVVPARARRDRRRADDTADTPDAAALATTGLNPRFTFANFVVGKANAFARNAAFGIATGGASFNPLFIQGGVGLGKTHLMNAIAWQVRAADPDRQVLYRSAEKFMCQFVDALRHKEIMAFKETFRAVDILMIDDIQFIADKTSTQEEFFHTFNALIDLNRQIVVSGDRSPSELRGMDERLRSRLGGGLVANIQPADYALRHRILCRKLALGLQDNGVAGETGDIVPDDVMQLIADRITSNVRELEGALNRILAHVRMFRRPVNLDVARELLRDLLHTQERRVTVGEIQKKVADHYGLRMADMMSTCKQRAVARPRQVAMYLVKRLTNRSLPEIGRKFGGRDHTTVMHAVRRIEHLIGQDPDLAVDVETLERALGS